MRWRRADLRGRVNGNLELRFGRTGLTSYAGLEFVRRYFDTLGLVRLVRRELAGVLPRTDFGVPAMVLAILALLIAGGRRLRHLRYVDGDPLVLRLCGLRRLPTPRTVGRWLRVFPARDHRAAGAARGGVRDQGAVLPVGRAQGPGAADARLDPRRGHGELRRARGGGRAVGAAVPRGDLPPARAARDGEELPARSLRSERRPLRVLGRRHEQGPQRDGPVGVHVGARHPRKSLRRAQGRVCLRLYSDDALRG